MTFHHIWVSPTSNFSNQTVVRGNLRSCSVKLQLLHSCIASSSSSLRRRLPYHNKVTMFNTSGSGSRKTMGGKPKRGQLIFPTIAGSWRGISCSYYSHWWLLLPPVLPRGRSLSIWALCLSFRFRFYPVWTPLVMNLHSTWFFQLFTFHFYCFWEIITLNLER